MGFRPCGLLSSSADSSSVIPAQAAIRGLHHRDTESTESSLCIALWAPWWSFSVQSPNTRTRRTEHVGQRCHSREGGDPFPRLSKQPAPDYRLLIAHHGAHSLPPRRNVTPETHLSGAGGGPGGNAEDGRPQAATFARINLQPLRRGRPGSDSFRKKYLTPCRSPDNYQRGTLWARDWMNIAWSEIPGTDLTFRTYVEPVPVPGAVLLGVIGLGCAGWRLRRRSRGETGASAAA